MRQRATIANFRLIAVFATIWFSSGVALAQAKPILALGQSRGFSLGPQKMQGRLARELVRQALLIAARDELGLQTYDAWLEEPAAPVEGLDFDLKIDGGPETMVEVQQSASGLIGKLTRFKLASPSDPINYVAIAIEAETLSRERFPAILTKALKGQLPASHRLDPRPPVAAAETVLPPELESRVQQMNVLGLLVALRDLHRGYASDRQSRWLGGLVRVYSQLGYLLGGSPGVRQKIFRARALLYAQRWIAAEPESTAAIEHRAFALALCGLHAPALEDVATAEALRKKLADRSRAPMEWLPIIVDHCRFEFKPLRTPKDNDYQLATLSRMSHMRDCGYTGAVYPILDEARKSMPMSKQFVILVGHLTNQFESKAANIQSLRSLENDFAELSKRSDISTETVVALRDRKITGEKNDKPGFEVDYVWMGAVADSLYDSRSDDHKLQGEPSWQGIHRAIREEAFVLVAERGLTLFNAFMEPTDELFERCKPLLGNYPYFDYFGSVQPATRIRREAMVRLMAAFDFEGYEFPLRHYAWKAAGFDDAFYEQLKLAFRAYRDDLYEELAQIKQVIPKSEWSDLYARMKRTSPHSSYGLFEQLRFRPKTVEQDQAAFEARAARYVNVLREMAQNAVSSKKYDEAERLMLLQTKLDFSNRLARDLSDLYQDRGRHEEAIAVLAESIKHPQSELSRMDSRVRAGWLHAARREWRQAATYIEGTLDPETVHGLASAANIYEGLYDWKNAEALYRRLAENYPNSRQDWYFFCRRTGQGDLKAARELAQKGIDEAGLNNAFISGTDFGMFYLLEKKFAEAHHQFAYEQRRHGSPLDGLMAAFVADRMGDIEGRDRMLLMTKERQDRKKTYHLNQLAGDLIKAYADTENLKLDQEKIERRRHLHSPYELMQTEYFVGAFLVQTDREEAGIAVWKKAMVYHHMAHPMRTIACAELIDRGITPDKYREIVDPAFKQPGK